MAFTHIWAYIKKTFVGLRSTKQIYFDYYGRSLWKCDWKFANCIIGSVVWTLLNFLHLSWAQETKLSFNLIFKMNNWCILSWCDGARTENHFFTGIFWDFLGIHEIQIACKRFVENLKLPTYLAVIKRIFVFWCIWETVLKWFSDS